MTSALPMLAYSDLVSASGTTITAGSYLGDLTPANVADPRMGLRWRTDDLSDTIDFDFSSDQSIDHLLLRFARDVDLPTGGTIRHYLDADGGTPGAGAAWDSGAVAHGLEAGYAYHWQKPPTTVTARYWRVAYGLTGASFVDLCRAWAGSAITPDYGFEPGWTDDWEDLTRVGTGVRSGAAFVDPRPRQRVVGMRFGWVTGADRTALRELKRSVGAGSEIVACLDPGAANGNREVVLGRIAAGGRISQPNVAGSTDGGFAVDYEIRESI